MRILIVLMLVGCSTPSGMMIPPSDISMTNPPVKGQIKTRACRMNEDGTEYRFQVEPCGENNDVDNQRNRK